MSEAQPAATSEDKVAATVEEKPAVAEEKATEAGEGKPAASAAKPAVAPSRARQWVPLRSHSMDLRVGTGNLGEVAQALRSSVGRPHGCALVYDADATPANVVDTLRVDLSDKGFDLKMIPWTLSSCELGAIGELDALLAQNGVTGDDLVVAVAGYKMLAVASAACSRWCGGVSLAEVPLDVASAISGAVTPRALDLPGLPRMVFQDGSARSLFVDTALFDANTSSEEALLAYALMVQTATCESDKAFGRLWDAAEDLVAGDPAALVTQLQDTIKIRGKVVGSTSAAVRQSIEFGQSFAHALRAVVGAGEPASSLLADGMRFAARLGVALESFPIDDMFAIDDLLERLGVGTTEADVDPDALVKALCNERFLRTNRLMLAIPRALGRVRLSVVTEDTIAEHIHAWCASRGGGQP